MGFNFPNSPTVNQVYIAPNGPTYVWDGTVWKMTGTSGVLTADSYNRVVNGAMQHSQENGDSGSTASGFYPADQWSVGFVGPALTIARSASIPASGSKRIGWTFSTGKPSLAATDHFHVFQKIEGSRIADFLWGTAQAKPIVVRFWAMTTTTPGTYTLGIKNGVATPDRSYLAPFTLAAINTWTLVTLAIPGDTTGTWPTDTSAGMLIGLGFAAGTTLAGVPGWQAGNMVALATATNGAATNGNTFFFGDVGLYADPNNTSVAPPWQMPDFAFELRQCQRYFHIWGGETAYQFFAPAYATSTTGGYALLPISPALRTAPAMNYIGTFAMHGPAGSILPVTSLVANYPATESYLLGATVSSGLAGGQGTAFFANNNTGTRIIMSARM
jgi:hypothetical protein